ncbi:sphingosine kinase [Paenibacillus sp. FSL A5-0031]|uniref:diacylglycerol/lipid kinase family protein n=1 Tax=Paenibacillus sp. FSL A5-0031 TaxID=1920420 RepID=UPI00096CE183|nr:diacylglycerol kinase family protein [Paenibacillus sp. FSL A5-0031]OME82875.1 sphingosine kinase [Paenibacillus sp. FSL A5-0031]
MKKAMIIINPTSGKEEALNYVRNVEDLLADQRYDVTIKETAKEQDATLFCISACEDSYDLVVSIGGDGTLHETINGLINQEHLPKLGVVPLGTVNDFARALQIPLLPDKAIHTLSSSRIKIVDLGQLNDQLFVNTVAVGSFAESLSSVTSDDKSRLGALAYVKEGIKELMNQPTHPLHIQYDGETWEGESPLFLAALTNSVGGFERLAPDAAVDDGLLHCFIIKDLTIFNTITASLSLLFGNFKNHKDVVYFTAKNVSISSSESVRTNVDGEEGPSLPIHISSMPRHIQVIVSEEATV